MNLRVGELKIYSSATGSLSGSISATGNKSTF